MTAEKHPLETVWEALTLHHSMVRSGEYVSDTSENKYYAGLEALTTYMSQTQSCAECERLGMENARLREAVRDLGTSLKALLAVETQSAGLNENTISNKQLFEQFMLDCESAVRGAVNLSRKNLEKHAATIAAAGGE